MDRLITAILNLTREGRREFEPVRIETRELIESIVSTMAHQASEAQAEIRIAPLPDLISDRLALEQIFSNLIDNALKYLKPGVQYLKPGVPGEIYVRGRTNWALRSSKSPTMAAVLIPRTISAFSTCSAAPANRTGRDRASDWRTFVHW